MTLTDKHTFQMVNLGVKPKDHLTALDCSLLSLLQHASRDRHLVQEHNLDTEMPKCSWILLDDDQII